MKQLLSMRAAPGTASRSPAAARWRVGWARLALTAAVSIAAGATLVPVSASAHTLPTRQVAPPLPPLPPIVQFPQLPPNVLPGALANVGAVELGGLANTRIFNPRTNTFAQVGDMHHSRWYPSAVMLADGKVFVGTGVRKSQHNDQPGQVRQTETFDPASGRWTENGNNLDFRASFPLYARYYLAPNGKIFYSGSGQGWAPGGGSPDELTWGLQRFFNLRSHQWELAGTAARSPVAAGTVPDQVPLPGGGTTRTATLRSVPTEVMLPMRPPYRRLRILMAGGVAGPSPDTVAALPISETYTIDRRGRVSMRPTGNMNHPRWAGQGVTLPTGEVVAFNGADREEPFAPATERPIHQMEIYDPVRRSWRPGAVAARDRTYHNTAVLLPDARVLVGGHAPAPNMFGWVHDNPGGANGERDPSFEVYSPPYLFTGIRRPRIARVQSGIRWGRRFAVRTPDARRVRSVVLSRLPAQTHTYDNNARTLRLAFRRSGRNTLRVKAPPNGVAAPPGPYYLFINGGRGARRQGATRGRFVGSRIVPSVARIVSIGPRANKARARSPLRDSRPRRPSAFPDVNTTTRLPGQCLTCPPDQQAAGPLAPGLPALPPAPVAAPQDVAKPPPLPHGRRSRAGSFTAPFDEGGAAQTLCQRTATGYIICKPAAQTQIVLPNGRVLFWDGFPGTDNSRFFLLDGGDQTHNSETRVLSLRSRRPTWAKPTPVDGGAVNPEVARGTVPNDAANNDGDIFCSNQVHLSNGRILIMGGTDWYTDPGQQPLTGPLG